ncbi:RDD family protein [Nocardia blacklockiae]|uniref:RDD family protein n=1 Tax=Nocardia blacklockiae TaxID=480036 RepID=UPI001892F968|nr:RDD family protein [Nocardia blacklockiae]MBF6172616.1 RDD family protein [Nocardia blacklockiae]
MVAIGLNEPSRAEAVRKAAGAGAVVSVVLFCVGVLGVCMVWIRRRRVRSVRRHPWTTYPVRYLSTGRYEYVQLLAPHGEVLTTLLLSTWAWDVGKLVDHTTRELWFAGDPQHYGVISRPGGGDLRYAYRSQPPKSAEIAYPDDTYPGAAADGHELARGNGQTRMKPPEGHPHNPVRHGRLSDPDYPSPRKLRRVLAFVVDVAIHLACGIGGGIAASPGFSAAALRAADWKHLGVNTGAVVGLWLLASFVNRVVVQAVFHTTVGKALFGLVILRPDTGKLPGFGRLLAAWLLNVYLPFAIVGNGIGPDRPEDYFMPAVRRRDYRQAGSGLAGRASGLT